MGLSKMNKKNIFFIFFILSLFFIPKECGQTPLDAAAFKGREQIVEILLEKGKANVNSQRKVLSFFLFQNIFKNESFLFFKIVCPTFKKYLFHILFFLM